MWGFLKSLLVNAALPPDRPVVKQPCQECGVLVLPQTALANDGMCINCGGRTPEQRAFIRERKRRVASGEAFVPTPEEVASATDVHAMLAGQSWQLQKEFYANKGVPGIEAAVNEVIRSPNGGSVYLTNEREDQFDFSLNEKFGVLTFIGGEEGGFWYACTAENVRVQVPEASQVVRGCPCCGVGLYHFASRFHMPRTRAIEEVALFMGGASASDTKWLRIPDTFFSGMDSD
jgi:hypothetical protein